MCTERCIPEAYHLISKDAALHRGRCGKGFQAQQAGEGREVEDLAVQAVHLAPQRMQPRADLGRQLSASEYLGRRVLLTADPHLRLEPPDQSTQG